MKNKILYLILHTEKQSSRCFSLKKTFLRNKDYIFFSDHEDTSHNIIKVSDDNSYKSNEEKFVNLFKILPETYLNYDWYFMIDNDTFVNTELLEKKLNNLNLMKIYGSILIGTFQADPKLQYLSGGAGILISNKVFHILRANFKSYNTGWADVSLGLFIKEFGNEFNIAFEHLSLFNMYPHYRYKLKLKEVGDFISFHYIVDDFFMELYFKIVNNDKIPVITLFKYLIELIRIKVQDYQQLSKIVIYQRILSPLVDNSTLLKRLYLYTRRFK